MEKVLFLGCLLITPEKQSHFWLTCPQNTSYQITCSKNPQNISGLVGIYASENKYVYLKNRLFFLFKICSCGFFEETYHILESSNTLLTPCFCNHIVVVIRAQVGSPALQGWSFCLDFQQSSQAMLLSAHSSSQPDTQKLKGILRHYCEVKYGEALNQTKLWYLYSCTPTLSYGLKVVVGRKRARGLERERIRKWGWGVCYDEQQGPL